MAPNYYSQYPKFHVAVDCIIFGFQAGRLKLLLQKRPFEPRLGEWSLMGGFVRREEDIDDAAKRVLTELTGLKDVYMEQVGAFGSVNRDSGDRVISIAYSALLNIDEVDEQLNRDHGAHWEGINESPTLLFDHREMVDKAYRRLKAIISHRPVGFNLLPPLFTLSQLQALYEAILDEPIDKRNFRKKISEMHFIEKTESIDKESSKRGAALYRFNEHVYNKLGNFKL